MKERREILQLLERLSLPLLEAIGRLESKFPGKESALWLMQLASSSASEEDRSLLKRIAVLIENDVPGLFYTMGAAAAIARARALSPPAQLVLSGPHIPPPARDTSAVVSQMITSAQSECLLLTYAFSHADITFRLLLEAVRRGVRVTCVFDPDPLLKSGTIATKQALQKLQELGTEVLAWSRDVEPEASMHAKAIVVDRTLCLITSANLTERAFTRNVEIGVLLNDPEMSAILVAYCDCLRAHGRLVSFDKP